MSVNGKTLIIYHPILWASRIHTQSEHNTPSFPSSSFFSCRRLRTWWWLHLLMPININYSRKIAKLLKVIGCDKRRNIGWRWKRKTESKNEERKVFRCRRISILIIFLVKIRRLKQAKFITIIIIAHDVPDSPSLRSENFSSFGGLMKKLFLLFHSTKRHFPAFPSSFPFSSPFIFFPREQILWKAMAWNSDERKTQKKKVEGNFFPRVIKNSTKVPDERIEMRTWVEVVFTRRS